VPRVSRAIDRIEVTFDDETLVADAGLIVPATLMVRLGSKCSSTRRCGWPAGRGQVRVPPGLPEVSVGVPEVAE
jgi:hypothetical protein